MTSSAAPPLTDTAFADLIEELTARFQTGEPIDTDAILREHPEYADRLNDLLPALKLLANLSRSVSNGAVNVPLATDEPLDGTLGDFRLIREVGRGGMGIVYEAEQISLNRRVALKVLPFAATMDPRQLQRFRNEAQAAACLHHPNIVPVHGVGVERGVHYYAMQLIEGQTLAEVIKNLTPRPPSRNGKGEEEPSPPSPLPQSQERGEIPLLPSPPAPGGEGMGVRGVASTAPNALLSTKRDRTRFRSIAALIADAADALEYAHSMGVVHRDIKPGNLMLDSCSPLPASGRGAGGEGHLWITDFGLAKLANPATEIASPSRKGGELTLTGDMIGTLRYMSPEAALAKHGLVDHRTDIYSLGATLYELLTLHPAVAGADKAEMLKAIAWEEPTPLRKLDKSIPAELETITLKCLAKEPGERYASAGEMAADLRRWLGDRAINAKPPGWREKAAKWGRRHAYLVGSSAALLIVVSAASCLSAYLIWDKNKQIQKAREAETLQRSQAEARLTFARELAGELYSDVTEKLLLVEPAMEAVQERFLRKSLEFFQRFATDTELGPAGRRDRAHALNRIAIIYGKLGQHDESVVALEQAIPLFRKLLDENPANEKNRAGLALAHHCLATVPKSTKRSAPPESSIREAIELRESLVKNFPANADYRRALAGSQVRLGMLMHDAGRHEEAEQILRHVIADYEQLIAEKPTSDQSNVLAGYLHNLAAIRSSQGDKAEAIELFRRAIDIDLAVVAETPRSRRPREYLANHYSKLASSLAEIGQHSDAEDAIRNCISHRERLVQDFPKTAQYRSILADNRWVLAAILTASNRPEAELACRQAIASYEDLPEPPSSKRGKIAQAYDTLGLCLRHCGKLDEAATTLTRALEIRRGNSRSVEYSATLHNLGLVRFDQGDVGTAIRSTEEALDILRTRIRSQARDTKARRFFCIQCAALATYLTDAQPEWRDYPRAIAVAREALAVDPKDAGSRHSLGRSLYRSGEYAVAIAELETALLGLRGDDSSCIDAWLHLALAYCQFGDTIRSTLYFAVAVRLLESQKLSACEKKRLIALRDEASIVLGVRNSEGSIGEQLPQRP